MPLTIVFSNQKKTTEVVLRHVRAAGWSGVTLSSDKSQQDREAALQAVRDGDVQVLVATDVAGRGIDIPDVCKYPDLFLIMISQVLNSQLLLSTGRWPTTSNDTRIESVERVERARPV